MADELTVSPTDRVGVVGATGSGKTFWKARFVMQLPRVIVVDTKRAIKNKGRGEGTVLPGFKILTEEKQVMAAARSSGEAQIIYRPKNGELSEDFWRQIRRHFDGKNKKNITVDIDEAAHVTSPARIDRDLRYLVQAGREGGVGIWWAGQRPNAVNNILISESERMFVFLLRVKADRDKIGGVWGPSAELAKDLAPREFITYGVSDELDGIATDEGVEAWVMEYSDTE